VTLLTTGDATGRPKPETIHWTRYPDLYVAHWRGVHFYQDEFDEAGRLQFIQESQVGQNVYAIGLLQKIKENSSIDKHETLDEATVELIASFESLAVEKDVKLSTKVTSPSQLKAVIHRYLTEFESVADSLKKAHSTGDSEKPVAENSQDRILWEAYAAFNVPGNPFVSTSSSIYHAMMYGSGAFKVGSKGPGHLLRPGYYHDEDKKAMVPRNPILGKLYLILHSVPQLARSGAHSTQDMIKRREVNPSYRYAFENETIFPAFISGENVVYEWLIRVPTVYAVDSATAKAQFEPWYGPNFTKKFRMPSEWFTKLKNDASTTESELVKTLLKKKKKLLANKNPPFSYEDEYLKKANELAASRRGVLIDLSSAELDWLFPTTSEKSDKFVHVKQAATPPSLPRTAQPETSSPASSSPRNCPPFQPEHLRPPLPISSALAISHHPPPSWRNHQLFQLSLPNI
jgi:hypothetical protein